MKLWFTSEQGKTRSDALSAVSHVVPIIPLYTQLVARLINSFTTTDPAYFPRVCDALRVPRFYDCSSSPLFSRTDASLLEWPSVA
jgi:hypothetical protein